MKEEIMLSDALNQVYEEIGLVADFGVGFDKSEMAFSDHFCNKDSPGQHKAGMNFANKYNPFSPAFTSCGTLAGKTEITPGS